MTGRVHSCIGAASAMTVCMATKNTNITYVGMAVGACVLGALVSDVDSRNGSKFKNFFEKVLTGVILFVSLGYIYMKENNLSFDLVIEQIKQSKFLTGFVSFIIICLIGYFTEHRTFTHYLITVPLFAFPIYLMCGVPFTYFFIIGIISHQIIDFLNKEKITWLWPLKIDFALYKMPSESGASSAIGIFALAIFLSEIAIVYHEPISHFFLS